VQPINAVDYGEPKETKERMTIQAYRQSAFIVKLVATLRCNQKLTADTPEEPPLRSLRTIKSNPKVSKQL